MSAPMDRAGVVRLLRDAGWSDCSDYGFCDSDGYGCPCESIATRILAALEAAGLRVVPAQATEAMLDAAEEDEDGWRKMPYPRTRYLLHYYAMLAASPFAPPQSQEDGT